MPRTTIVNLSERDLARAIVSGFRDTAEAPLPHYIRETDVQGCRFFFVVETGDAESPFRYLDPTTWQLIVGGGDIGDLPTDGTFTITDPATGQTTAAIPHDADGDAVQVAVRAALTTFWPTAVVTGVAGGPWTVTCGTNGNKQTLTVSASALLPANSTAIVTPTQEGTVGLPEQCFIELARAIPIGRSSGWTTIAKQAVAVAIHQAGDATHNKVFKVTWDPDAYSGDVQLRFTGNTTTSNLASIPYNATEDDVLAAFEAHTDVGTDGVAVVKEGPGVYYITCVAANISLVNTPALSSPADTIVIPPGLEGSLNVTTAGVTLLLNGGTETTITQEIRINRGTGWEVVSRVEDVPLYANLIRSVNGVSSALDPTPTVMEIPFYVGQFPAYVGGVGIGLDGVATLNLAVNRLFCFVHATHGLRFYLLLAGTVAEASPGIIRPDDYNAATNAKYWKSVL